MTRTFKQVDVFTAIPYRGNPVAVVLDAEGLTSTQMQSIARWTNLSETTFVLPATHPDADFQLRIFTPMAELAFAGHPTLGSAHAVLESRRVTARAGRPVQQCAAGLIVLHVDDPAQPIFLELPVARFVPLGAADHDALISALGISLCGDAAIIELGPRWLTGEVTDIETLLALKPHLASIAELSRRLSITGVNLFARSQGQTEVRSFAPAFGIGEDPVCGSGNGAVAALLSRSGHTSSYVARQGRCLERDGYVFVKFPSGSPILLGGHAVTCVDGHIII